MNTETPLDNLIRMLGALPGLGNRSARRIALHLLNKRETLMLPLARSLEQTAEQIRECTSCGNLDMTDPCRICSDTQRDRCKICVISSVSDLWAIERTRAYKGEYHILGGVLSALDGIGPEDLRIRQLVERLEQRKNQGTMPSEIILALAATVDGQSTAHYVSDALTPFNLHVTRLAHGVPVGGELDYLDEGTISTALKSRSANAA